MPNQRYQSIRTFSVSLLVMSLFMLGANMDTPSPDATVLSDEVELKLTKTCESTGALGGSFHLAVTNSGTGTATGVEVTDDIPTFITLTGPTDDDDFDLETGVWDVGTLGAGETAEIWIDFTASEQGEYMNHAEITDVDQRDDGAPGDDEAECTFVIVNRGAPDFVPEKSRGGIPEGNLRFTADLAATKVVDVETAPVNGRVHYTVWVENLGPQSTAKVQATDHLPDCLTDASWDDPPPPEAPTTAGSGISARSKWARRSSWRCGPRWARTAPARSPTGCGSPGRACRNRSLPTTSSTIRGRIC